MFKFLSLTSILLLIWSCVFAIASDNEYGVMIDAGSSGTRIFVYSWPVREEVVPKYDAPFSYPVTQPDWSLAVDRPIAKIVTVDDTNTILTPLTNYVKNVLNRTGVSDSSFKNIPIYLGATAGMRLVPFGQRRTIMTLVRMNLHNSGFAFLDDYAKILSGEEEGLFGWLAVNHLYEKLWTKVDSKRVPSLGALDLGGASTQITFEPNSDIMASYVEYNSPNLIRDGDSGHGLPERYQLYSTSFLGNGLNELLDRHRALLVQGQTSDAPVTDPCLNSGAKEIFKDVNGRSFELIGSSGAESCKTQLAKLVNLSAPCAVHDCSFDGRYQPRMEANEDTVFIAFSGFHSVVDTAAVPEEVASLDDLSTYAALEICALPWDDLVAKLPDSNPKYLVRSCTSLLYMVFLLRDGYGISGVKKGAVLFQRAVDNVEVSWALGRMLYEANLLGYEHVRPTSRFYIVIGALIACIVVLTLMWIAKKKQVDRLKYDLAYDFAVATNTSNKGGVDSYQLMTAE